MNVILKKSFGILTLALWVAGCSSLPFSQPQASKTPAKTASKAPVVDRSTRRLPLESGQQPQVEVGRLPQEDSLQPREYSANYPPASTPYPPSRPGAPAYPDAYDDTAGARSTRPYAAPPTSSAYPPPAYPPGAATPPPSGYPSASRPAAPQPARPAAPPARQPSVAAGAYATIPPASGALPEPQPVVPRAPRTAPPPVSAPAPAETAVAMTTPPAAAAPAPAAPAPAAPAPRPAQPASPSRPPADLPPAEISREGNQAVAALLDSADKYVKSNQLDKAGAALERALRVEPRNAGIWHDLAQIRLHQGQYQQAESLASKSNNLASSNRALQSRNWKVIAAARKATGNARGAEEAEAQASQLSR